VLKYLICSFILIISIESYGQWNDSALFIKNYIDDVETAPLNNYTKKTTSQEKGNVFYDSLAAKAIKRNWSKELYHLIMVSPISNDIQKQSDYDRILYFTNYINHTIRAIDIVQLDVFGPTIYDTTRKSDRLVNNMGNSIHIATNKKYIKNNLIINVGERIDPYILADNERILRNISSLQDVRIVVVPVENMPSMVDIKIISKDVMPFGLSWEAFDVTYGQTSVWNTNILGLGHSLKYTAYYNLNQEPKYGYSISYKIPNISNSFLNLSLTHTNKINLLESGIKMQRDFITPSIRYGGGFTYLKRDETLSLETIDTTFYDLKSNYEYYDFWGGYSYAAKNRNKTKIRKNYFITARTQIYNFIERPDVQENYLYDFYKRNLYLTSFGLIWQGYYNSRLVYGFGKTEDIPLGAMIKLTGGFENNEYTTRQYYGGLITISKGYRKIGYITNTLEVGGFYNNKIEQGAINYEFLHISPIFGNDKHEFRNFITINYVQGINRFDDEFTIIEDDEGIRGINSNLLKGTKSLFFNTETVYYSPQYIYGFRLVYYAFFDAGIINNDQPILIDNPIYTNIGIGVKIRNERLVFNTIQLQLNYFPTSPGLTNGDKQYVQFTSYTQQKIPEFANRIPDIVDY
jgi:hypothetical protein